MPTPEDAPFPVQTSLYGASKLACEGMIAAYVEGYDMKARIFGFVLILGQRYSHGHVFHFMKQLGKDPNGCTSSATAASVNPTFTSRIASRRCCSPSTRAMSVLRSSIWGLMRSAKSWTVSVGLSGG